MLIVMMVAAVADFVCMFVCLRVFELHTCILYISGFSHVFDMRWDSIARIELATGLMVRGWNPGGVKRFYFLHIQSLGPPSSCAVCTQTLSRGVALRLRMSRAVPLVLLCACVKC